MFFGSFFGPRFWDKTWTCSVLVAKNRVFCWSHVLGYVEKTCFFNNKCDQKWHRQKLNLLRSFSEIVTAPTRELDFWRAYTRKKWEKTCLFCAVLEWRLSWVWVVMFNQFLMIFHNPSFCLIKTKVFEGTVSVFLTSKMS